MALTCIAGLAGLPQVSLPAANVDGCPAGLSFIAWPGGDEALLDIAAGELTSGAAHDTQQIARIAPVAMIFVRSRDGRSHTPEEFSTLDDMVDGIRVLAAALHKLAY